MTLHFVNASFKARYMTNMPSCWAAAPDMPDFFQMRWMFSVLPRAFWLRAAVRMVRNCLTPPLCVFLRHARANLAHPALLAGIRRQRLPRQENTSVHLQSGILATPALRSGSIPNANLLLFYSPIAPGPT